MSALGLGLLAALCWGVHDITIRYLSRSVPLLGALLAVLLTGLVFQGVALAVSGEAPPVSGRPLWLSLGSGAAFLAANIGLYFAFERGPVRLVAPLIGAYPILSLGFAVAGGAEVGAMQIAAILAVIAGTGLVAVLSDRSDSETPPIGRTALYSLLSCCGFATAFELGQMAAEQAGESATTMTARLAATVLLIALLLALRPRIWPGVRALPPLAIMGVLDGVALLSVISAARLPSPEYAAVAASMFGLLTILLAWAFLKERMTPAQWLGGAVAFGGIGYLAL